MAKCSDDNFFYNLRGKMSEQTNQGICQSSCTISYCTTRDGTVIASSNPEAPLKKKYGLFFCPFILAAGSPVYAENQAIKHHQWLGSVGSSEWRAADSQ